MNDYIGEYIKKMRARRTVIREFDQWQEFTLTTSWPPDTQLHMRGGEMWRGSYGSDGAGWMVDDTSWDITEYVSINYATLNAYVGMVMTLKYGGYSDVVPRFFGGDTEYETAIDAENAAISTLEDESPALEDYPLAIVILRNDGDITQPNSFLPIDPINRKRSYLWQDVRPTHWA